MKKYILLFFLSSSFLINTTSAALNFGGSDSSESYSTNPYYNSGSSAINSETKQFITFINIILLLYLFIPFILSGIKRSTSGANISSSERLVLTNFIIDDNKEDVVVIEGRKGGLMNFILSKLNIQNKTIFKVNKNEENISMNVYGMDGNSRTTIDFNKISSITIGTNKKLFITILYTIIGLITILQAGYIILIGIAIYYHITKSTIMEFETNGGKKLILSFSSSIIENITIDSEKMKQVEDIIIKLKK